MSVHDPSLQYEGRPLRGWKPDLPAGTISSIYLHWSGGDYRTVYPAYHFCVARYDEPLVFATHDLRENMRDVRQAPDLPYAAHTRGRNSYAAGISIMCMRDSAPDDFGAFPLTDELIDGLCRVSAAIAAFYAIPIDAAHVMTHAEAARADGYFGAGSDDLRWDIARLAPDRRLLVSDDAVTVGEMLREKIRAAGR